MWLNVLSDAAIAIAYFSIPIALHYFLRKRLDVPFRTVVWMFSVFILACGVTHIMSIVTVWNGYYGVQGILKAITALSSVAAAIMLVPVMPKLLALRSPRELEASNIALHREIEQRRHSELQTLKLQQELAHAGRLTTMGQMATGLAHELNQPLTAISQSADTAVFAAKDKNQDERELVECLEDIQAQTQRAGEIIRALRQFVSKDVVNRTAMNLNSLVSQSIRLINPEARAHNIRIDAISGDIPELVVDRVQIVQVLVNLLRNGVDALLTHNNVQKNVTVKTHQDGDRIVVSVQDTGPGLRHDVEPFIPFESTKVDGMGMGLSISRSIIESHGGKLWVDESANSGARFSFSLPVPAV